jgi:hypothetical protein
VAGAGWCRRDTRERRIPHVKIKIAESQGARYVPRPDPLEMSVQPVPYQLSVRVRVPVLLALTLSSATAVAFGT